MADSKQQDLEALLAEALGDFQEPLNRPAEASATAHQGPASSNAPQGQPTSTHEAAAPSQGHQTVLGSRRGTAGRGLGAGLGARLPARKQAGVQDAVQQTAADLPSDAGGRGGSASRQLPPHIQQLAAELMGLVDDAGIGAESPQANTGPDELADAYPENDDAAQAAMQALLKELQLGDGDMDDTDADAGNLDHLFRAMGEQFAASSEQGDAQEEDSTAAQSDTVRQLMQRTRETVQQQAKLSGTAQAPRAARSTACAATGSSSGGGLPFGDLLGSLGGLAGMAGYKRSRYQWLRQGDTSACVKMDATPRGGGGEGANGANFVVDFIMQNLLSKDVLYGPLKEIRDKYPPWLSANASNLSADDLARYTAQLASIQAVCSQYESDPNNTPRLMELIQEMQKHGDPPAAIVEDIGHSINTDMTAASTDGEANTGDADEDFSNVQLPPDFLKGLSGDLQKECAIQ